MKKIFKICFGWSIEGKILTILLGLFAAILIVGWGTAMKLQQTVAANAAVLDVDFSPLLEVEQLRHLAESKIANRRAYFLMGSKSIFEKQKDETQLFNESLEKFEKQHSLPQVSETVNGIKALVQQDEEFFDQGMEFREQKTESKIVGQFYNAKTASLVTQLNEKFDQIAKLHNAAIADTRRQAREAGLSAQARIPQAMTWLTGTLAALFAALALLIVRMLRVRQVYLRERGRLVDEAKKALLDRDEVIAATSQDFKDPLSTLGEIAENLKASHGPEEVKESAELIESVAAEIQGAIDDIYDQKKSDMGNLTLRLDQLDVADILEDAKITLQPLAKQRDINLQFDSLNHSTLAYVDRERVLRVLANLVGNAIKFSRKHGRVSVKVKSDAQFVTISVADSGPGIPEAQLANIFDHFWQARSTADQGAGIGLGIVKTIIEAHGGTVHAEKSNIGQGCTFAFTLPRRRPAGAQIKKPSAPVVRRVARSQAPLKNIEGPAL